MKLEIITWGARAKQAEPRLVIITVKNELAIM